MANRAGAEGVLLRGPREPHWACGCGEAGNFACRLKCKACKRPAPRSVANRAREADKKVGGNPAKAAVAPSAPSRRTHEADLARKLATSEKQLKEAREANKKLAATAKASASAAAASGTATGGATEPVDAPVSPLDAKIKGLVEFLAKTDDGLDPELDRIRADKTAELRSCRAQKLEAKPLAAQLSEAAKAVAKVAKQHEKATTAQALALTTKDEAIFAYDASCVEADSLADELARCKQVLAELHQRKAEEAGAPPAQAAWATGGGGAPPLANSSVETFARSMFGDDIPGEVHAALVAIQAHAEQRAAFVRAEAAAAAAAATATAAAAEAARTGAPAGNPAPAGMDVPMPEQLGEDFDPGQLLAWARQNPCPELARALRSKRPRTDSASHTGSGWGEPAALGDASLLSPPPSPAARAGGGGV